MCIPTAIYTHLKAKANGEERKIRKKENGKGEDGKMAKG